MAFNVYLQCPEEAAEALSEVAITLRNLLHRTWLDDDPAASSASLTVLSEAFFKDTSAEERLEVLKRPRTVSPERFEAALRAARHSLVAACILRAWPRLLPLRVHCYSPLVFDEPVSIYRRRSVAAPGRPVPPRRATPVEVEGYLVPSLPRPHVLQTVVLKADRAEQSLRRGSVGVVAANRGGVLDVEFGLVAGAPRVRLTLHAQDVDVAEVCVACGKIWDDSDWGAMCRECSRCGHQELSNLYGGLTL